MKQFIYADNAATTKLDIDAFDAMVPFFTEEYANSSQIYSFARKPRQALKKARAEIAACINAEPEEIYFTSGGTESNNWAVKGIMPYDGKCGIITSQIEHHSVLNACKYLENRGTVVNYLPVTAEGIVTPEALSTVIASDTRLVSIQLSNNEIGTVEPIGELCEITHKSGALFHTDAVGAVGHIRVDVKKLGVDMLSASAHKFNGPKGIGFLYIKKGTPVEAFMCGGAQEYGLRGGTENIPLIIGMSVALKKNVDSLSKNTEHLKRLEKILLNKLQALKTDFIRNGKMQIPGLISLSFCGADGEMLLHRLDLSGIAVSTGAACDSHDVKVSHVLRAIGLDKNFAKGTVRISFGVNNSPENAKITAEKLISILCGCQNM